MNESFFNIINKLSIILGENVIITYHVNNEEISNNVKPFMMDDLLLYCKDNNKNILIININNIICIKYKNRLVIE